MSTKAKLHINSFLVKALKVKMNIINILFLLHISAISAINVVFYDIYIYQPIIKLDHSLVVLICSLTVLFLVIKFKNSLRFLEKPAIFFVIYLLCTLVQIMIFQHDPSWDVLFSINALDFYQNAQAFPGYLIMHKNNIGYFGVITLIDYLIPIRHESFNLVFNVINALLITLSLTIIGYKLIKLNVLWGKFFYILCLLFLPLMIYATIPYTDTLSLIFIASALYFFVPDPKNGRDWASLLCALFFISIGFLLKQSIFIIILAFSGVILMTLSVKRNSYYKIFIAFLPLIFCIGISWAFNHFFVYGVMKADKVRLTEKTFPMEHYLSMGQNSTTFGAFSMEDDTVIMTSLPTENYDHIQMRKMLLERAKQRIADRGFWDNLTFFTYKFSKVWGQPDFYAFQEGADCNFKGLMHNIKCRDEISNTYKNILLIQDIQYTMIIFIVLFGSFYTFNLRKEHAFITLSKLSLVGIAIFLLIWEARSRYIINFMPFMLLLAAYYLTIFAGHKEVYKRSE